MKGKKSLYTILDSVNVFVAIVVSKGQLTCSNIRSRIFSMIKLKKNKKKLIVIVKTL